VSDSLLGNDSLKERLWKVSIDSIYQKESLRTTSSESESRLCCLLSIYLATEQASSDLHGVYNRINKQNPQTVKANSLRIIDY